MEVFDLVAALRDPCGRDYESERLDPDGHTYIYRYLAEKRVFLRATKPSGASAPVFRALSGADKVPLGGWIPLGSRLPAKPRLVKV